MANVKNEKDYTTISNGRFTTAIALDAILFTPI